MKLSSPFLLPLAMISLFTGCNNSGNAGPSSSTVSSVQVSPPSATVTAGQSQQFSVSVAGTGGPSQAVNGAAQYGQITSSGYDTAPATGSSDLVIAQSAQSPSISGQAVVTLGAATGVATFSSLSGVAVDAAGTFYFTSWATNQIYTIPPGGTLSVLAGSGWAGSNNGPSATATFNSPWGVSVDSSGNVYVADYTSNIIRLITPGGLVSTLAGVPNVVGSSNN